MSRIYELFKDLYQKVETSGMTRLEHQVMEKYVSGDLDFCILRCDYNGTKFDLMLFLTSNLTWGDVFGKNTFNPTLITRCDKFAELGINYITINASAIYRSGYPIYANRSSSMGSLYGYIEKEDGTRLSSDDLSATASPRTVFYVHLNQVE